MKLLQKETKIANLLYLKLSTLGNFFKSRNYTVDLPMVSKKTPFL